MNRAESYARLKARRPEIEAAETELALSEAIADLIVGARVRAGMSQSELAKKVGTSQARISEIERGQGNPTLETLARLAVALRSSIDARAFGQIISNLPGKAVIPEPTAVATFEADEAVTTRAFHVTAEAGLLIASPDDFIPLADVVFARGVTFFGGTAFVSGSAVLPGTGLMIPATEIETAGDETDDNGPETPSGTPLAANSELALAA